MKACELPSRPAQRCHRSFADDEQLARALAARGAQVARTAWDADGIDWHAFDAVIIRSTWDYATRRAEFVAWAASIGPRLHNAPDVVRWNCDKRYLADLAGAGIGVVPTIYVAPGEPLPPLQGEVVVKPTVSAGGNDTGRFGARSHQLAVDLLARIHASGRTAMVQPYLSSVDSTGETAIVCIDGRPSHVLHKRAVLRPDEVAPVRDVGLKAAEAMFDPALVVAGEATADEMHVAALILDHVTTRFGYVPLYARVDLVAGEDGAPVLMELEAVEPSLYLDIVPGAVDRVADAVIARIVAP